MNTITLKLAVVALLATACSTAHAGLEWSLSTNTINDNNTADADLEVVFSVTAKDATLNAIRTGDYGTNAVGDSPTCVSNGTCDVLSQYSLSFSIDATGDAAGATIMSTASDLLGGFNLTLGDSASVSAVDTATALAYEYAYSNLGGTSFASLFATSETVDVFKLSIDIEGFEDNIDVSDILVSIDGGEGAIRTQFGEFGSIDSPENTNDVFFAFPTANSEAPGFGDTVTQTYSVDPAAIPEPSSFAYMGLFTLCVTGVRWYRRRKQA